MKRWLATTGARLGAVVAVLVMLPVGLVASPLLLPAVGLVDLATGRWRLPTVRLVLFGLVYLAHQWVGIGRAVQLLATGRRKERDPHDAMQAWWISSLMRWAERLLGASIDWPDLELPPGRFIVVSRHASAVDAVIPAILINSIHDRPVHYVLKAELGVDPSLGYYGRRLGNHFVRRGADRETELAAIADLGANTLPRSGVVIFPEGTYANEANRSRILASLEGKGPSPALALARELDELLPPKPAGLLALLDAAPEADVVFLAHVGVEGVATFGGLRRRIPLDEPVRMQAWTVPRAQIPDEEAKRVRWLNDWWRRLDTWVAAERSATLSPGSAH